jgi:DNA-binding response OmpR family regulator
MRGDVLLVDAEGIIDPEHLRAAGLRVYRANDIGDAIDRLTEGAAPEVVVVTVPPESETVDQLRRRADSATSIIVVGRDDGDRTAARRSGADSFLSATADVLYEIHRALILRRSGRRLPWM